MRLNLFEGREKFVSIEKFYGELKDIFAGWRFFAGLRNCEWLKLFCCAGEFYQSTRNFLGSKGFFRHAQNLFWVLRELVQSRSLGWLKMLFVLRKVCYQMKVYGVLENFFCFTEDFDAALSNIFVVKYFSWKLQNFSLELKNFSCYLKCF